MVAQKRIRFGDTPILSLRAYSEGGQHSQLEFIDGLQKSWDCRYGGQGFGKFTETSLNSTFTSRLLDANRRFFEGLSTEEKLRFDLHCRGQRGYTGFGVEGAKDRSIGDLKEILMWGRDGTPGEPVNIDPPTIPELQALHVESYEGIERDNRILYRAVACMLDVDPRYFYWDWQHGRNPNSSLRTLYYPPVSPSLIEQLQKESGTKDLPVRAAEHGDINRITWLYLGDSSEGLQMKQSDGSWENVLMGKGFSVVNVGDILSTETDGVLPSAIHRVIVARPEYGRYSFPCFTHPAKGKNLRRLLTHPENPGDVYRAAFVEVYGKEVYDLLAPCVQENLGKERLRIRYDHFLERRLADIGLFNDDLNLKERVLAEFEHRLPRLADPEEWERAA